MKDSNIVNIEKLRGQIDHLDRKLVDILVQRQQLVKQVARQKTSKSEVLAEKRVREMLKNLEKYAKQQNVDSELVFKIFATIIKHNQQFQLQQITQK